MNKMDWKVIVLLGIILSVVVGFLYGTGILGGDAAAPGTEGDPLVTQSYADKTISDKVKALEAEVESLTLKVQVLENDLTELYTMVNKTPSSSGTKPSTGTTGTGTTGTGGSTTTPGGTSSGGTTTGSGSVSADNIGKTATISKDNNVVNLRKAANTSAEIVKKLSQADSFTITKVDKDWYQVQLADGTTGWVAGWLVTVK
jgi:hypothetical protein